MGMKASVSGLLVFPSFFFELPTFYLGQKCMHKAASSW